MVRRTGEKVKRMKLKIIKYAENYMKAIHCINICERFVFALGRGKCGM